MIKKYKNILIILAVIVGVVLTAVIFCFTLFTVKDIKLDYRTNLLHPYSQTEIIEKSGIDTGSCVFFLKKDKFEENIEKNFPYLKVINIETVIPSHIIIHLAEREEFYAVEHNGNILICDDEFKVLRIVSGTSYESTTNNAIFIPDELDITNEKIAEGEFLEFKQDGLKNLYNSMLVNSRTRPEMLSLFKQIEISDYSEKEVIVDGKKVEKEYQTSIKLTTHNDRNVCINNIDHGLKYKLQKTFAVLSAILDIQEFVYDENKDGVAQSEEIYRKNDTDDIKVGKMFEILSKCDIFVSNYASEYQYDESTEKIVKMYTEEDCYFHLSYNGVTLKTA